MSLAVERAAFGEDTEVRIVEAVRDLAGSLALVATDGDELIGHVQLSPAQIGAQEVLALGPIGVEPARQRQGVGTALVADALRAAGEAGVRAVILLGSPAYYGPRGFEPARRHGLSNPFAGALEDGFEIDEDDFQIAILDPSYRPDGVVRWHEAFG